ncbi:hypothetical protein [Streptomyces cadmiisoli]|uniref:hypothetical protein n=1 Tax=Streptomyces cadmiisoli TaxID=2184053 RepID=UPI003D75E2A8
MTAASGTAPAASRVREHLRRVDTAIARRVAPGPAGRELLNLVSREFRDLGQVRLERVGSARCGTSVAGFSDVDVLVVFTDPIRDLLYSPDWLREVTNGTWNPADGSLPYSLRNVLDVLAETPAGEPPAKSLLPDPPRPERVFGDFADRLTAPGRTVSGFDTPRPDFPAVTFASKCDEPSIELVPGLEADFLWDSPEHTPSSGLSYRVFPGTRDRWLGTNPEQHDATLSCSPGGSDYTCREMIRLLKLLLKYAGGVPLRSYFVELFAMRWIEGSHDLPARTVEDILERMAALGRHPYAHTGRLTRDIASVLAALAEQLRTCTAGGRLLDTVDLTTPETSGQTEACATPAAQAECADGVARLHEAVLRARHAEEAGDAETAVDLWQRLLHPPGGPRP